MAGTIFSENYRIANFETDIRSDVTLQYLLDVIVQVSEDQSQNLQVGTNIVQQSGVTWVVIQYDVDINRLPKANESVKIQTQGTSYTRNFADRHFWIRDMDDNILVSVNSLWVMMNLDTRKMVKIDVDVVTPYGSEKVKRIEKMRKIKKVEGINPTEMKYPVCFTDIDFNGHVSNTRYIGWMSNTLDYDFLKNHVATKFSVKFADEVRYGDHVVSQAEIVEADDSYAVTAHQILVAGKIKSVAQIEWKKTN